MSDTDPPPAGSDPRLADALARVGASLGLLPDQAASVRARLGGLTNANYLIEAAEQKYVLRLPGPGTAEYIDRAAEEVAARATAAVGVNAQVVWFDAADGVQLCRFVEGGITMSEATFKDKARIRRAAIALRKVHCEAAPFTTRFELFTMIDQYSTLLAERNAVLPEGFAETKARAGRVRAALAAMNLPLAPCHCDPLAENFIDTRARMIVVDWEYAGNNDPMWDLADLAVEAGFDAAQEEALLDAYFDGAVPLADRARVTVYKVMCDLLWTLWGVIQHVDGNPAEDFWAYATGRLARCRNLMASPTYASAERTLGVPADDTKGSA